MIGLIIICLLTLTQAVHHHHALMHIFQIKIYYLWNHCIIHNAIGMLKQNSICPNMLVNVFLDECLICQNHHWILQITLLVFFAHFNHQVQIQHIILLKTISK